MQYWLVSHLFCCTGKSNKKNDAKNEVKEEDLEDTEAADEEDLAAEEANPQEEVEGDTEVEGVVESFGKMKVVDVERKASKEGFCMDFSFPHIVCDCEAKDRKVVTIDFLIVGMHKKCFRPKVNDAGDELHVGFVVPSFFAQDHRILLADQAIRHNTHKMTAFRDVRQAIIAKHGDGSDEEPLLGEPQKVQLPFIVEREIRKWEMQTFANDNEDFLQHMQEIQQFYFVLTVTMLSVEKRYKKKDGNFRLFGSPRPRDMEEDDDESGDEY